MFIHHPLNATIRFGAAQPSATGEASTSQLVVTVPGSAPSLHNSLATKGSISEGAPTLPVVKSMAAKTAALPPPYNVPPPYSEHDVAQLPPYSKKDPNKTVSEEAQSKASPPENSKPKPKSLPDRVKSMSEDERNTLMAKLIDVVGQQQAQLNEQQLQLEDFFQEQHHLNASPHNRPPNTQAAQVPTGAQHNNPFAKPAAAEIPLSENILKAPLRFLSAIFPTKYVKNLPMSFLESFVQNAGATVGSRAGDVFHDKLIVPRFYKKPPERKKTPVKDAFKDAAKLAPEFAARSFIDHISNNIVSGLVKGMVSATRSI